MQVRKDKGIFYVRKNGSSTGSWSLYYQFYKDKKRVSELVQKLAYPEFGFRLDMTLEEARKRAKQLNAERKIEKDKIRNSAERVVEIKILNKTLFPPEQVEAFVELLDEENFGSDIHLSKIRSHFNFIQRLCVDLKLSSPAVYRNESKKIYKYFLKKKISVNYAKRLISILNRWGKFVSKNNGSFYEEVLVPKGRERSAIAEAQRTKEGVNTELGVRTESAPLTPENLEKNKQNLSLDNYNWLYLSVWLGLRPEEVDSLKDPSNFQLKKIDGVLVLRVYQSKLMSIPEDQRWKNIPLIFTEQQKCVSIINEGLFKRPLTKTLRKYLGEGVTLYGGRKNFVDLCLDRGQDFVDIAAWMGHKDTSITFKVYKNRETVRFKPVTEKKKNKGFRIA